MRLAGYVIKRRRKSLRVVKANIVHVNTAYSFATNHLIRIDLQSHIKSIFLEIIEQDCIPKKKEANCGK